MNALIDTLAFADNFETAGFAHDQARALANAFAQAQDVGRQDLVTKSHFDVRLAEFRTEIIKILADQSLALTQAIASNGKDISNRLWSTVTIIAGVSTAISATIGAGVALILKWGGL